MKLKQFFKEHEEILSSLIMLTIILLAIIALGIFLINREYKDMERENKMCEQRANVYYSAWCKEYGNPDKLTLEEFWMSHVKSDFWGITEITPPVKKDKVTP